MYDTTIADRLRAEGLRVVECDGWQSRGDGNFDPGGFVFHHTAGGANGTAPSLEGVIYGFANSAPGPLANLLQSREPDGNDVFYVVAAGKANHAGTGGWNGIEGNHRVYGLEIEHTGIEHFPQHRAELACRAAAALLRGIAGGDMACQHYEWSNWGDGSKIDVAQDVDANVWRAMVDDALAGRRPPEPEPESEDDVAYFVASIGNDDWGVYLCDGIGLHHVPSPDAMTSLVAAGVVKSLEIKALDAHAWTALIDYDARNG